MCIVVPYAYTRNKNYYLGEKLAVNVLWTLFSLHLFLGGRATIHDEFGIANIKLAQKLLRDLPKHTTNA